MYFAIILIKVRYRRIPIAAPAVSKSRSNNSGDRPVNPCKNSIKPPYSDEHIIVNKTIALTLKFLGRIKPILKVKAMYAPKCIILSPNANSLIISGGLGTRESIRIIRAMEINPITLIIGKYCFIFIILKTGICCRTVVVPLP